MEKLGSLRVISVEDDRYYVCECKNCKKEVYIDRYDFTNTCEHCGTDYNGQGSELAPRSQWGEETGESWMDCY